MPCYVCSIVQTDPGGGGPSPWVVGVIDGQQVLLCPTCRAGDPEWEDRLDRCPRCSSTRLKKVLGSVLCRGCGNDFEPGELSTPNV